MKSRKKIVLILLAFCTFLNTFCVPVFALDALKSEEQIICYEDGSYAIVTITYDSLSAMSARSAIKKTSGTKEYIYYSSTKQPLWTFRVHGSFEYDGRSTEATSSNYSQEIHDSFWSFVQADAYCSGASAVAKGTFKYGIAPISTTITLTCSANGVLS